MSLISARVIVAIPTLTAGEALLECLASLETQSFRDFAVIVIDNSGQKLAAAPTSITYPVHILRNDSNVGFGAAINQAAAASSGEYIATLNDDCIASPEWLAELVRVATREYEIGLCAAQVRLADSGMIDSAGILIALDASSKQRGFGQSPERFPKDSEVLCPSGCAALYRRDMFEDVGGFDESFFLYCEDTDLGLRARWAGWQSYYSAKAVVTHRYSHSAGRSSELKALLVERNRMITALKNLPSRELAKVPFAGPVRYAFHLLALARGKGITAEFNRESPGLWRLLAILSKAHWQVLCNFRSIWKKRSAVKRRLGPRQMSMLLKRHRISLYSVASL
ncbi:MAG: glycosyltransferase family 2 protein [Bryobacteraceae bacterium]